jgi:hypothetical protein
LLLQGFQCTLTSGQCFRFSETFSRLSDAFPSKTGLFGQTFQRCNTHALRGFGGEALYHPFASAWLFFALLLGAGLFLWGEFARSAAPRFIVEALGTMVFPLRDPARHGVAIDLIGLGNVLAGRALVTQQHTMGAGPSSAGGICLHRLFKELTLIVGQRLNVSHHDHLIRAYDISHETG